MTDIVERLRSRCGRETMNGAYADGMWEDAWSMEAADEIERLRAALEDIADGMGEDPHDYTAIGRYAPAIARAALEGK